MTWDDSRIEQAARAVYAYADDTVRPLGTWDELSIADQNHYRELARETGPALEAWLRRERQ